MLKENTAYSYLQRVPNNNAEIIDETSIFPLVFVIFLISLALRKTHLDNFRFAENFLGDIYHFVCYVCLTYNYVVSNSP